MLSGDPSRHAFPADFHPKLKHIERGTVGMATVPHPSNPEVRLAASQFIVSLGDEIEYLDGKSAIFGKVVEGFDVLEAINSAIVDENGYPLVDIRILHTVILDDPYPDPPGLVEPTASPPPSRAQLNTARLNESALHGPEVDVDGAEKLRREREARAQALTLEMMGDLPFAEVKPPENVLFVCKLNPITRDEDLELIFSRFGTILSCEVIRDRKTGDSLQYAFVEFEDKSACEAAYFKMQDVLIDDRRIHIDFSQSVSKLSNAWRDDTNAKRQKQASPSRGGWGGVRELEKWRKYRDEDNDEQTNYGLVHSEVEMREKVVAKSKSTADDNGPVHPRKHSKIDDGDDVRRYKDDDRYGRRDRGRENDRLTEIRRDGGKERFRDRDTRSIKDSDNGQHSHNREDHSRDRRDHRHRDYRYRSDKDRSNAQSRSPRRPQMLQGNNDRRSRDKQYSDRR